MNVVEIYSQEYEGRGREAARLQLYTNARMLPTSVKCLLWFYDGQYKKVISYRIKKSAEG